jgi:hypothetical protein
MKLEWVNTKVVGLRYVEAAVLCNGTQSFVPGDAVSEWRDFASYGLVLAVIGEKLLVFWTRIAFASEVNP